MLVNLQTFCSKQKRLVSGLGVVVDNLDPQQRGWIRVSIEGQLEGSPDVLPWCCPIQSSGLGQGGSSTVMVPDIGSTVWIEWSDDDPYCPQYIGQIAVNTVEIPPELLADYPSTYGWSDGENQFWINRKTKDLTIRHMGGQVIVFKQDGSATITVPGGVVWDTEDLTLTAKNITISGDKVSLSSSGDTSVSSGGALNLEGSGQTTVTGSMIKLN